jgi:WD40 repeat protein
MRVAVSGALELRDGRLLSWSEDTTLRLWAADGTELAVLRGHEGEVSGALELRDGRLLSWSEDKTLRLWAADGTELSRLARA